MWAVLENPIVMRELRSRMRGNRAVWVQGAYLMVLAIVVGIAYQEATAGNAAVLVTGRLGRTLFDSLCVAQGMLLALVAPAFAAGGFTAEREQQTLDTLFASPLSAGRIVRGKLVAANLFLVLLLTTSVPLLAICLLFGGVGPTEVAGTYAVQLANGLLLAAVALGWSLVCAHTTTATIATYATVAVYLIVTSIAAGGAAEGFALAAIGPLSVSFAAGYTMPVKGHAVPIWVPSLATLLLLSAWATDVVALRARRLRDQASSGRPRAWLLLIGGLLLNGAGRIAFGAASRAGVVDAEVFRKILGGLLYGALFVAVVVALIVSADDADGEPRRRGRWWVVWQGTADSGPLFTALLPWLVWPTVAAAAHRLHLAPAEWLWPGLTATVVVCVWVVLAGLLVRYLNEVTGRRWPAVISGALLLTALLSALGVLSAVARQHPSPALVLASWCSPFTAVMDALDTSGLWLPETGRLAAAQLLAGASWFWLLVRAARRAAARES